MSELAPSEDFDRTCILWEGGWLYFDAVISQEALHEALVTDYPVEPGAGPNLTDNVQVRGATFSLEARVTNSPDREPLTHTDGARLRDNGVTVTLKRPLVPDGLGPVSAVANQTSRVISSATGGRASLDFKQIVKLTSKSYFPPLQRVQNAYQELLDILEEGRLLTVVIGQVAEFDNCVIERVRPRWGEQVGPGQLAVAIDLKRIRFSLTKGLVKARTPAKPRGQDKKAGGRQQTKDAAAKDASEVESTLSAWKNGR